MVLGANLKPMKAGQMPNMYNHLPSSGNINPIATFNGIAHGDEEAVGFNEDVVKLTLELQQHESLKPPESVGEFEKFFCKKCRDAMQRYTYMRLVDFEHYKAIIVNEFDAEVFLTIVDTFQKQVIDNMAFSIREEQLFIAKFMTLLAATPKFDFLLDFMEDNDRAKIKKVIDGLDKITDTQEYKDLLSAFDTL